MAMLNNYNAKIGLLSFGIQLTIRYLSIYWPIVLEDTSDTKLIKIFRIFVIMSATLLFAYDFLYLTNIRSINMYKFLTNDLSSQQSIGVTTPILLIVVLIAIIVLHLRLEFDNWKRSDRGLVYKFQKWLRRSPSNQVHDSKERQYNDFTNLSMICYRFLTVAIIITGIYMLHSYARGVVASIVLTNIIMYLIVNIAFFSFIWNTTKLRNYCFNLVILHPINTNCNVVVISNK
jgi:hypothetical protein